MEDFAQKVGGGGTPTHLPVPAVSDPSKIRPANGPEDAPPVKGCSSCLDGEDPQSGQTPIRIQCRSERVEKKPRGGTARFNWRSL